MQKYLSLMKFGIIFGNMLPLLAGFVLAGGGMSILMLNTVVFGFLIMACGCIFNNCYDADIDRLMQRTKNRVLPQNLLPISYAVIFGVCLCVASFFFGFYFLNTKTLLAGFVGLFFYTIVYTIITKRRSGLGVHFGSISGAMPPMIGYLAFANEIHPSTILFFFVLIFWQMPHSFAIEIFRHEDFTLAKIKTVPSYRGIKWVKCSIVFYILLYIVCNIALCQYTNIVHQISSVCVSFVWLKFAVDGFAISHTFAECKPWARKVFFLSIVNMIVVSLSIFIACMF